MRGVILAFLLRTTPQECVIRKGKLKETFVTVMGKISVRPVCHGFIRSGPDVTSMVETMKVMVMMALVMMPVRVKAQTAAKNVAGRFRKACKQVVDRKGAAADN